MKQEWIECWRGLPKWIRRDILRGSREQWVYSGMFEVGWSMVMVPGVGWTGDNVEKCEGRFNCEGEAMVISIPQLMEWIRVIMGGGIEFYSSSRDGGIVVGVCREEDRYEGYGTDRELAFFGLIREIGEWYWSERRPSLCDISKSEIMTGMNYDGELSMEIREGDEGIEVRFEDFWIAKLFMSRWYRFVTEENNLSYCGIGEYYHGRMEMVEGKVNVRSNGDGSRGSVWGVPAGVVSVPGCSMSGGYNVSGGGVTGSNLFEGVSWEELDNITSTRGRPN